MASRAGRKGLGLSCIGRSDFPERPLIARKGCVDLPVTLWVKACALATLRDGVQTYVGGKASRNPVVTPSPITQESSSKKRKNGQIWEGRPGCACECECECDCDCGAPYVVSVESESASARRVCTKCGHCDCPSDQICSHLIAALFVTQATQRLEWQHLGKAVPEPVWAAYLFSWQLQRLRWANLPTQAFKDKVTRFVEVQLSNDESRLFVRTLLDLFPASPSPATRSRYSRVRGLRIEEIDVCSSDDELVARDEEDATRGENEPAGTVSLGVTREAEVDRALAILNEHDFNLDRSLHAHQTWVSKSVVKQLDNDQMAVLITSLCEGKAPSAQTDRVCAMGVEKNATSGVAAPKHSPAPHPCPSLQLGTLVVEGQLGASRYGSSPASMTPTARTGIIGEDMIYRMLVQDPNVVKVTWLNEEKESGLPYDILVERRLSPSEAGSELQGQTVTQYVEVKTTRFESKRSIDFTYNEWRFAQQMGPAFVVYRVFNCDGMTPSGTLSFAFIQDPYEQWRSGKIGMRLELPAPFETNCFL